MSKASSSLLRKLETTRFEYGSGLAALKTGLLAKLERRSVKTARELFRLHEHLCFLRAYPDDPAVHAQVTRMLERFAARSDLNRHRSALADTGIAGTVIHYQFFWPTARWLAVHWPGRLEIDWENIEDTESLVAALPLLVTPLEATWLRLGETEPRASLRRLKGPTMADGAFLIRRVAVTPGDHVTREAFFDGLNIPFRLRPAAGTPSRTLTHNPKSPVVFRSVAPERSRPDLARELMRRPPSIKGVSSREGERLIDLARVAMVTRERDLDNFAYGDLRDVRMVDDGDGLQWIVIGTLPERRPVLRATYGMLVLRNGVPIGYVGADALFRCVDISYNIFPTFRGGEAGWVFARTLAALRALFGARSFTIEPYQLGRNNDEALESGAWWFYYKLGFRPRNPATRALVRRELTRMKARPRHRSSRKTLRQLAEDYLYFEPDEARAPYWPRIAGFGGRVAEDLAARGEDRREDALRACLDEAQRRLGARPPRRASKNILAAWRNWSAVVTHLPDVESWTRGERMHLARVITAKGQRSDADYLALFDSHPRLAPLLRRLTGA